MSIKPPNAFIPSEYAYLAARLTRALDPGREVELNALLLNNVNVIIAALDACAKGEAA